MIRTSPRPLARRASLIAGTLMAGTLAATIPSTPAQAAVLPTCTITFSGLPTGGIPVPGTNLTSTIQLFKDATTILSVNLPIAQAVVSLPTGTPIPTALPSGSSPLQSLPYTVLPADIGNQLVGFGQINPVDSSTQAGGLLATALALIGVTTPTLPIPCTPATTPPVVSPPVVSPPQTPGGTSSTTLGATPVSSTPRVAGRTKVRKTVRADLGTIQSGVTATYQWFKMRKHHGTRAIGGATGATYRIKPGIRGKRISVVVTYSKAGYTPTVLGSGSRRVR